MMRENRIVDAASRLHAAWGIHLLSFKNGWFWATFLNAEGNPPVAFVRSIIGDWVKEVRMVRPEGRLSSTDPAPEHFQALRGQVDCGF
jgi:hypothetical protein